MTPETARRASDLLVGHWTAGTTLDDIPEALRPRTRAEGYRIQAELEARSGRPLAGWKIAATSTAGQRHINVDGPLAGRLLAERVFPPGAVLVFGANRMAVAEPEFCFRMGRTLEPRAAPYVEAEVLDAVAALHVAIEIPDSRYTDFTAVGAAQLIADNACAHEFVLGPATTADWRSLDLAAHRVTGRVSGGPWRDGVGRNVLGGPTIALVWLANELSALGIPLRSGHVVTTGTCMVPLEIRPGDLVEADFGELGAVSVSLR
jgi:2-keto-4-pentenoate hydratase